MDWNAIRIFLALCESGTLVSAAERTGVSHATAFRHMSALETDLGTRLFDRIKGRYVLTDAGREMQRIGQSIAGSFDDIERRIAGRDKTASGTIRLTAPRSFADLHLPGVLARFSEAHPEIEVELLVSNLEANMSSREADVALRVAHAPPDHLWGRRILSIDWAMYGSEAYIERHGRPENVNALGVHRVIGPTGKLAAHPAYASALGAGHRLTAVKCDDLTNMAHLASAGHGLALLPDDLGGPDLVRLFGMPDIAANSLWVLTHPDLRSLPRVSVLMGYLAKTLPETLARDVSRS